MWVLLVIYLEFHCSNIFFQQTKLIKINIYFWKVKVLLSTKCSFHSIR